MTYMYLMVLVLNMAQGIAIPLRVPQFASEEECMAALKEAAPKIDKEVRGHLACLEVPKPQKPELKVNGTIRQ